MPVSDSRKIDRAESPVPSFTARLVALLEALAVVVAYPLMLAVASAAGFRLAGSLLATGTALAVVWLFLCRNGEAWGDLGLRAPSSWKSVGGWVTVTVVGLFLVTGAVLQPLLARLGAPAHDLSAFDSLQGNWLLYLSLMVFVVWGSAGVGEEIVARGFLWKRLLTVVGSGRHSALLAVLIQGIVFGLGHSYQGWSGIVTTGMMGIGLGLCFLATGRNLWGPILSHCLVDSISVTALFLGAIPIG